MNRNRSLARRHRRILAVSIGLSVAAHVALLGLEFSSPSLEGDTSTIEYKVASEAEAPLEDNAIEVVTLEAATTASAATGPVSEAAPGAASMSAAASTPAGSSSDVALPVPQAVLADAAFEQLTVFDPISTAAVEPLTFDDLPSALTDAESVIAMEGEAEDDVEVYVPGSIGKAKRAWSGDIGTNPVGKGDGIRVIFGGGGGAGGHCPMPGRAIPPSWR